MMHRNKAFDVLKAVFTLVIVIHHSEYFYGVLNRGYIVVEFFFITSGYYLCRTFTFNENLNTLDYLIKRAERLFPEYWFAFAVTFFTMALIRILPYKNWYSPFFEFLMLQNIGIKGLEAMNYPCWYLSVLMVGGTLIYFLLRILSSRVFNVVASVIITATYLYLATHSLMIEQWDTVGYLFYLPFWRGMADMLIGVLLFQAPDPDLGVISQILECFSGVGLLVLLWLPGYYDYLAVILIIILIWMIRSEHSVFQKIGRNNRIVEWIVKYQYSIYVTHACVIFVFRQYLDNIGINGWLLTCMLLMSVFLIAVADKTISDMVKRRLLKD